MKTFHQIYSIIFLILILTFCTQAQTLFWPARLGISIDSDISIHTTADFNSDGILDIATIELGSSSGEICVILGELTGNYEISEIYEGLWPESFNIDGILFQASDFNGDEKLDIIFCRTSEQNDFIYIFQGDGTGNFAEPIISNADNLGLGPKCYPIGISDFNTDGLTDIIYTNLEADYDIHDGVISFSYYSYILLGDGNGNFSISDTLIAPFYISSKCALGDFNEDGSIDIAFLSYTDTDNDSIAVYHGNGTGNFSEATKFVIGKGGRKYDVADFNGDGHLDIIAIKNQGIGFESNSVIVFRGGGDGTFIMRLQTDFEKSICNLTPTDFNEDGILDLVIVSPTLEWGTDSFFGDGYIGIMIGVGDGTFNQPNWSPVNNSKYGKVSIGDINNNGHKDIIFATSRGLSYFIGTGDGIIQTPPEYETGLISCPHSFQSLVGFSLVQSPSIVSADLNHDGFFDLAVTNPCSKVVSVLEGMDNGKFVVPANNFDLSVNAHTLKTADMNNDSHSDLLVSTNTNDFLTLLGDGTGGFDIPQKYTTDELSGDFIIKDFNGDSQPDIAIISESSPEVMILIGDGTGSFANSTKISLPDSGNIISCADFNEDGNFDLVIGLKVKLTVFFNHSFTVLIGDGNGGFAADTSYLFKDRFPKAITVSDFNEDGHEDVVVWGTGEGEIFLGDGTGSLTAFSQDEKLEGGVADKKLLAKDVNTDSHIDLIVSHYNRDIAIFLGKGDGSFTPSKFEYGLQWDNGAICSKDFNKDGAPDLAMIHSDTNYVGILFGSKGLEHDIALISILSPESEVTIDASITPQVVVLNRGSVSESVEVECNINNTYNKDVQISINPGEQQIATFPQWIPEGAGSYNVIFTGNLEEDQIPSNNQISKNVIVIDTGTDNVKINKISPNRGGDNGWITVSIFGENFQENNEIRLVKNGENDIIASGYFTEQTSFISAQKIKAVFDLNGACHGSWDLVIENPDGSSFTFKNGLTVITGNKALWIDIMGKTRFVLSRHAETYLSYNAMIGNSGNVNLDNAVMILDIPLWLQLKSIINTATNDTLLIGENEKIYNIIDGEKKDSLEISKIDSTRIPFWVGTLNPGEVQTFQVNVLGDWDGYRDIVILAKPTKALDEENVQETGIGISGILMSSAGCFGKNLAESFADKGDLTIQDFENAGQQALESTGEDLFWTGVTLAVEILFPWTIPIIEGYNIASGLIGSIEKADQMFKLAFKFILLFAEWYGDPNYKDGPAGYEGYITDNRPYFYQIHFENDSSATISPPYVIIRDTLDVDLDWSTFENIESSHPITSTSLDSTTGEIVWLFDGIQLPPNKIPPEGEGWLSYSIWPKSDLPSGTKITNRGAIIFGTQDTILTNIFLNIIDNEAPNSYIEPMDSEQNNVAFQVNCYSNDSESGIYLNNIYVSENDNEYLLWKQTQNPASLFIGKNGYTYSFYSNSIDNVGNIESIPSTPDATTTINAKEDIGVNPNPFVPSRGHDVITFFGGSITNAKIKIYNKAGQLVRTLHEKNGEKTLEWDTTNDDGEKLASGVYIWVLSGPSGKDIGKFAIIR